MNRPGFDGGDRGWCPNTRTGTGWFGAQQPEQRGRGPSHPAAPRTPLPYATPAAATLPRVTRDSVLAHYTVGQNVRRVDRKEAKLITLGDLDLLLQSIGFGQTRTFDLRGRELDPGTLVWAVAFAGDIRSPAARKSVPWEIDAFDADTGEPVRNGSALRHGTWPPGWDLVRDRDPSPH